MSSLSDIIGNAKTSLSSSATTTLGNSASLLAQGNVQGAVSNLLTAPQDMINAFITGAKAAPGDGMGGIQARQDALQSWCWYVTMPPITNSSALAFDTGLSLLGTLGPMVALPWYYVVQANAPMRTFNVDQISRNGHQVTYPDAYSVDDLNLGFYLDTTGKAMQYLIAWQGLVLKNQSPKMPNNQGAWGLPAMYKKDIIITIISTAKRQMVSYRYINCFPKVPTSLSLSYTDQQALMQDISFSVEDVDITISNDQGFIQNLLNTATGYGMGALSSVTNSLMSQVNASLT